MSVQLWVFWWNHPPLLNPLCLSNSHSNPTLSKRTITNKLEKSLKSGKNFFFLPPKTPNSSNKHLNRFPMLMKWSTTCIAFLAKHQPETTQSLFPELITSKTQMTNSRSSNTMLLPPPCILTVKTIKMLNKWYSLKINETLNFNTRITYHVLTWLTLFRQFTRWKTSTGSF